jgi:hypothetical protein
MLKGKHVNVCNLRKDEKMKKIFLILCLALGVVACSSQELQMPADQYGVFRGSYSYDVAEAVLFDACTKAKWQVVENGQDFLVINFSHKGYDFDAEIQYDNNNYSIIFLGVNQDKGNLRKAYSVYTKYVTKLNKVIQKTVYNQR